MKNKKVLITGGCGFLGHHMIEHFLKSTNWDICVMDGISYAGDLNRMKDIGVFDDTRVKFVWHDLRSLVPDTLAVHISDVNYIVHLAAETHVSNSIVDPLPFIHSNVLGFGNLLDWAKTLKELDKLLLFSTDEVFGPAPMDYAFNEEDRLKPGNPYAATKAAQEMLAEAYINTYKMPILISRCMNLFGERQHPEKFIPLILRKIIQGEQIELHGNGPDDSALRCWTHCRTASDAVLRILERGYVGVKYHIVGHEFSVSEIFRKINIICGRLTPAPQYVPFEKARPGHDPRYALEDNNLIGLDWSWEEHDFDAELKKTIEWMMDEKNKKWLKLL